MTALYVLAVAVLAVPSAVAVLTGENWGSGVPQVAAATTLILGAMVVWATTRARFTLSAAAFWTWAFIFLGLAPAYQIAAGTFPWLGEFTAPTLLTAQLLVLVGCAACAATWIAVGWLHGGARRPALGLAQKTEKGADSALRPRFGGIDVLVGGYVVLAVIFCILVGPALFTGKSLFQARVVSLDGVVGFGTLYFLVTAGAICIPAIGWVVWRRTRQVRLSLVVAATAAGFVATNPLIGSRFLTGAFVLAVGGALLIGTHWQRLMPGAVLVMFVSVFPSLDLARGDGTGSDRLQVFAPHRSLVGFDFDAFEMLARAVSIETPLAASEPTRWELFIAPLLRWVPVLARDVQGHATGPAVARTTEMTFTNVSMPLWGESYFIGGWALTVVTFLAVGALLGWIARGVHLHAGTRITFGVLVDSAVGALLFMVLRGSLYEVLGYLLLAVGCGAAAYAWLRRRGASTAALSPDSRHSHDPQ